MPRAWGLQQHGASTTPSGAPAARCKTASSQKEQGGGNPPWGPSWQTLGPPPQRFHLTTFPPCPTRLCPQRCLHGAGGSAKTTTRSPAHHTAATRPHCDGPHRWEWAPIEGPHRGSPSWVPIPVHGSVLPPAPCQHPAGECPGWHHQKEHLTAHKPFFFSPLVLPARLSPLQGKQSCHCLNLTHPFNLGGRNAFVPDNMHQMVARGAPVAAGPDGWATRASPDLCLYVICIAAGGFSSRRQLQHHLPGSGSSPGAGSSGQEGPGHVAEAGTAAPTGGGELE